MDIGRLSADQSMRSTFEVMKEVGADTALEISSEQKAAKESAQAGDIKDAYNPKIPRKKEKIKARASTVGKTMAMKGDKKLLPVEQIKDKAREHSQKNPEFEEKKLTLLRNRIKPDASAEDIQATLDEFYPDATLADDALDFLLDTTDGVLHQNVKDAKERLNAEKGREILAGRNISEAARKAADKGLGTPTSMREMYRDVTGNPRDANTMFDELTNKYKDYGTILKIVKFLHHSMGADLKSKGPSIPRGELHNLMTETRTLQAILGVYRFFKTRMNLMNKMFARYGLDMPKGLTFEQMAQAFMALTGERYPSPDKVSAQAKKLGIDQSVQAKIITFSQFRDSIREVSINQIYRSLQHRDDLNKAIIDALEDLEDELETQEEAAQLELTDYEEEGVN